MRKFSATELRDEIEEILYPFIELHRGSRATDDTINYEAPSGAPTQAEITDFILSNPIIDSDTAWQLSDPGLLGFDSVYVDADESWHNDFVNDMSDWAASHEWAGGDLVYYHLGIILEPPEPKSEIWTPKNEVITLDNYLVHSPSHLLLAHDLLNEGRSLSELHWREFEKLIGELLEKSGWVVEVMSGTKDGGIDVLSRKDDPELGFVKAVWQAKKHASKNKVSLASLRELSAVVNRAEATKGILVTTSSLTKGAIDWIKKDRYRLSSKDGQDMKIWVERTLSLT